MKILSFFTCLLAAFRLFSQPVNLVLNPSFEKLQPGADPSCEYIRDERRFDKMTADWSAAGTVDLINWKPDDYGDCFFPKPRTGNRSVGIITYLPKTDMHMNYDYHEFVQGKLKFPLVAGLKYEIEFYVQQADSVALDHMRWLYGEKQVILPTAAGNLGIYFSYDEEGYFALDAVLPQFVVREPIVTKPGEWLRISGTFVPDRAYLFFTIGNFASDANTYNTLENNLEIEEFNLAQEVFSTKKKRIAYYCLDDVRISPVQPPAEAIGEKLKKKKSYTFKNVNFETGKWDILPEALPELDGLADFLKKNPVVQAFIAGHTDDVGKDEDNLVLSEKRAESVMNYLISKEIAAGRLSFRGYGEKHPVMPNDSPESRLQNRRVECKIK